MKYLVEVNHPLVIAWNFPYVPGMVIDDGKSFVSIKKGIVEFIHNNPPTDRFVVERLTAEMITATLRIPQIFFDAGEYEYEVSINSPEGTNIFNEFGQIEVIPQETEAAELEPQTTIRAWNRDVIDEERVSEERQQARMEICLGCPFYDAGVCIQCGCLLSIKTTIVETTCPVGNW
jgi:hypothetical protein